VRLDPNSGQANYNLALVLRWAGKSKEAIPVLQKAIRLEPDGSRQLQSTTCMNYFQTGDCKEAIAMCEKGIKREAGQSGWPRHHRRCLRCLRQGSGGRGKKQPKSSESILNSPWSPLWGTLLIRIRPTGTVSPKVCARRTASKNRHCAGKSPLWHHRNTQRESGLTPGSLFS